MSIQRIAAVASEVRALRSTAAPGGFAAALGQAAQAAPAATAVQAGGVAPAAPFAPAAPAAPMSLPSLPAPAGFASPLAPIPAGAWTLGAMLGLPVMAATTAVPGIAGGVPGLLSAAVGAAAGPAAAAPVGRATASAGGLVMPVEGRFSSKFGPRVHPITGQSRMHSGIDLAAPSGTPIAAAAAGTVTHSGPRGGYGNLVILSHADGSETRYAHNEANLVTVGQQVAAGEQIARVGSTGMSTGPHLHFEVRRGGEAVDPAPLLGLA